MLLAAVHRETSRVAVLARGGALVRAGTRHTAWTQHCLCGNRAPKQLRNRRHSCPDCGLTGDRDLVAALGAHTTFTEPGVPGSARIDWPVAHHTLSTLGVAAINEGLQEALTESTGTPRPHRPGARRPQRGTRNRCRRARRTIGNDALDNAGHGPPDRVRPRRTDEAHAPGCCASRSSACDAGLLGQVTLDSCDADINRSGDGSASLRLCP
ncbi:zinc ribbon domain-containing protein [Dactylosporangium sp. AC04546]|uniref:zinc ribbon domain-containing protein n=1 Tax=Dactylosporangium sp. AC04546 TaxID=2862460 RepID=UPI003FA4BF66